MRPAKELDPEASAEARFGYELRRLRLAAGLTQSQLGDRIGFSANQVGSVERAVRTPTEVLAKRCEEKLGLEAGLLVGFLPVGRREAIFKGFTPWLDVETTARELWTWEPTIVPGLLQTPDYARAILAGKPGISDDQVEEAVRSRMARKEIFRRDNPPTLWAVLDESILYRPIGDESITRAQLSALVEAAHGPRITIQILPLSARVTAGLLGGFVIAHLPGGGSAAFADSPVSGKVWERTAEMEILNLRYQMCRAEALPQSSSVKRIEERLEQEWTWN
ncbi:helix-turn-helix domain-containing protein [Nonomuraea rhizosphaerae]|uniref:helix-turn-helix domain-containing protein n=1 Tax=Nonomuraea rhizosphaerae TaxID=2665663 RepID=UPI001C5EC9A7|nr:helix-turn-helix transcriptional regulator [Nonomuraea rhizosphaerae]